MSSIYVNNILPTGEIEVTVSGSLKVTGSVQTTGSVQVNNTLTVGKDDTGYDVKFFGATSGQYMLWDESADELVLTGDSKLSFHDAAGGENIVASSNGHLEVNAGTTLDMTAPTIDINGTTEVQVDTPTFDVNGTTAVTIDCTNTSNGITIGTSTSGVPVSIGHTTSETTVNDNLTVTGDLTVNGTTTSVNSTTVNITSSFTFEGPADAHETTLHAGGDGTGASPQADTTIYLPAMSAGNYYLPVLAAASTTAISSTPAELNLLDGCSAGTVVNSKAVIYSADGDIAVGDNLTLTSDSSLISLGVGADATLTHDGTTGLTIAATPISINSTGDLTLDSSTDIILDAGGADILFKDDGTLIGGLNHDGSSNLVLSASVVDKDIVFKGSDNNSAVTAMTLDMSDAGHARMNASVSLKEQASALADTAAYGQLWVKNDSPNNLYFTDDAGNDVQITDGGSLAASGDITGVTAGDGLTGGGTSGGVTLAVGAGTGIDVSADAIAVDVSDFMANGANNRIVTATGADAMNAEANLTFDGSVLTVAGSVSGSGTFQAVGNAFLGGALNVSGNADLDGDLDVDGTTNLDAVDIDGNVQLDGTLTVGVNGTGYDVQLYGDTAGQYLLWDQSADELVLAGDSKLSFHDAAGDENIVASADGHLEINAGTTLDMTAPTVDINASTAVTIDGPSVVIASATSAKPLVEIKNTNADANGSTLQFTKDGASVADSDVVGNITFVSEDDGSNAHTYASVVASIYDASAGAEGGKLQFNVAEHDGTVTQGLLLNDGDADGEIDVTVGSGAASVVTVPGVLSVANDIILADGGSIKEGGGTAAITIDGSGHVTKIGQDSPSSGQFLKWDGSKAVWDAASSGGAVSAVANGADNRIATFSSSDALNGEANLTFDGSVLTVAGNVSGSGTLEMVGNTFIGGTLNVTGNADFNGTITCDDSITIDSVTITDTEIGYLDGLTLGTVAASKVVTADANKDFSGYRNISGSGTLQSVGNAFIGGTLNVTGNATLAADLSVGDDLSLTSDSAVFNMGAGNDFTITHDGTTGATIAGNPIVVDSGGNLTLDAHTGIFVFKDAGSEVLRFTEGNSGDVTVKLAVNGKDLIFTDNGDAEGFRVLDAAAGVKVPGEVRTTGIAYTDGDDAITIADGGGVTFSDTVKLVDDKTLTFGSNDDVTIEYDEDGTDALLITGDTFTYASANASDPLIQIFNSTDDANGGRLRFVKNRGTGAGQANDVIGLLEFISHDAGSNDHLFAEIKAEIAVATEGQEGGKLSLGVVTHDGETQYGLVLTDGDAEDEIDVTVGNGSASLTTVAGDLKVDGRDITLGGDSDGSDATVTFGHATLKTIMGIDDSADTFILNTDATFDATVADNSLSIDANHKMIVGGSLRAKGYVAMTYHQYAIGSNGERWVPWYDKGDLALGSATELVQAAAPFDGRLVRVIFRPESEQSGGSSRITLYKAANGTDHMDSSRTFCEHQEVTCSGNASTSNVFNFSGSAHFSAGEVIGFTIDPHKNPGEVNVTCIWEYNTTGL